MVRGQVVLVNKQCFKKLRKPIELKAQAGVHNRFDVVVMDGQTGKVKQEAVGLNIILDSMWNRLLSTKRGDWFAAISYGSGTGTLSASRTELFTRIGTKAVGEYTLDSSHFDDGYVSYRRSIQINAGEITGQTLREVGISYDTSANHLMTHAVLQDMNGNTISITVGELDVILIYATVYVRFSGSGYLSGNMWFGIESCTSGFLRILAGCHSSTSAWNTVYPEDCYAYGGEIGSLNSRSSYKVGLVTPNASTKKVLCQWSISAGASYRIGVSDLNLSEVGGWRGVTFGGSGQKEIFVLFPNSEKPYCSITDEAVGSGDGETTNFNLDFGFLLNDSSLVVKIDSVEVDSGDYDVLFGLPAHTEIGYFMHRGDLPYTRNIWHYTRSASSSGSIGDYDIVENPFFASLGVASIKMRGLKIEVSNDLSSWVEVATNSATSGGGTEYSIDPAYQKYRYWKATANVTYIYIYWVLTADTLGNVVSFDTPPAAGAAITASYRTENICKDTNHVVDLELEITLNEYTGS